jgi:hypothetical protein
VPSPYDVVFNGHEGDDWTAEEWLMEQEEFDAVWEGHEGDTRDLPGSAAWGTEDSFAQDPLEATGDTASDGFAVATGDFDYVTPDGSGDGNNSPYDSLPWGYLVPVVVGLVLLIGLAPYARLGAEVAG